MTRINKLVLNGFKSFGKWTEVPFCNGFNVVLGPNGSGKCLTGDSLVSMADGSIIRISELVSQAFSKVKPELMDDGFIAKGHGRKVLCLDMSSHKIVAKEISHYVKRKAPEKLLKISTRSGRAITATPYHPLFILSEGKVVPAKAEELKKGVRIAVPRMANVIPDSKCFFELLDEIRPEDNLYVPFNPEFKRILRSLKGKLSYEQLCKKIGIPKNAAKGLMDKQSINFSHLVSILRFANMDSESIINIIPYVKGKTAALTCKFPWNNTNDLARLMGYLLAEGRLSDSNQVWFTNADEEIVKDYSSLVEKVFGIKPSINEYKPGCWDVLLYSHPSMVILSKFGMSWNGTENKTISNILLKHSGNYELANLMNGLYSGDGYVSDKSIELTTKSKNLAVCVENILIRLGIRFSSKWVVKVATNSGFSGIYKTIFVCGSENAAVFKDKINLCHEKKRKRIEYLASKKANPNVDLLEVNGLIKNTSKELGLNVKKLKKDFSRLDAYCYGQCLPSVFGVKELVSGLFEKSAVSSSSKSLSLLSKLAYSDICWDEIIAIEEIASKEEWVYDLCVEKDHNFIANNIIVHNSNILDALCFVLGRMSSKSMRAEKLGYLVYNGGKTKKPASKAEVSIFFDNSDKIFPIESPHVKVSRLVKPDGQSIYRINDERRTRQQVLDLLSLAHIDPDGYNIVLQGDIIRFVEMTAEERRQVIEEIAGISLYEDKKQKAMNELDKVDQSLREAEIILSEKKEHLKELKQDRDQAIRYKDLNDKLRQNKATLLSLQVKKKEVEKVQIEKSMAEHSHEVLKQKDDILSLKGLVDSKKKEAENVVKEIEEKGEAEQVKLHKEIEELRVGIGTANSRTSMCDSELQKILVKRDSLKNDLADNVAKIANLENEKSVLEKARTDRLLDKTKIESSIERLRQDNKVANIGDLEIEIEAIEKDLEQKQSENQGLVERKQSLLREKDRIEVQLQSVDSQISKMTELEKENKKELDFVKSKRDEFKALVLSLNQALNEDSSFAARIADSKRRLDQAEEDLSKAKAKTIVKMELNLPVQKVLEQKERIKGIFGTVSELGKVQSKYSLALEVAAGPRLNSIVVQNEDVAAECIRFLKSNRFGVASFLPLTKLRQDSSEQSRFSKANGVHGLAVDLVSYDPKFKKVFSYVFGNTLVVESLDVAKRLGVGEARMVSIDGDLTELSGAMHGGFRTRKQNAFQEEEAEKELAEKESRVRQLEETVELLEKQRAENEAKISSFKQRKAEIEGEIIKVEKSLSLESADYGASVKIKESLSYSIKDADLQLKSLQESLNEKNRLIADIKTRKQKLRDQISELRNPAIVAELNAFEQKRRQLIEEIMSLDSQVKHIEVQVKEVFSVEKDKISGILKQLIKEEEQFNSEKASLKEKLEQSKKLLKEAEEKSATFHKKYRELFETKSKLAEEITKAEEKIIRKEDLINNTEVRLNNLSLKNAEVAGELGGLKRDFEQYSDVHLLEDATEDKIKEHLYRYERTLSEMGNVNLKALEVYDDVEKQYNQLLEKKSTLVSEKADVLKLMEEIEVRKKELFMNTFNVINENFINIFKDLSTKGEARLVIEDETKLFESGVRVRVNLSGEKFLDIRGLSGGEKSMTALAFIFAIQEYSPASFYIFDEVDAALDKKNSEKLSNLIKKYADRAQYIVISHNDNVLTSAETLFGISMDEHGVSNLVSLKV